jgi:hypothetical protein
MAASFGLTARRSAVAPPTLAIGTAAGSVLGLVRYALLPLGAPRHATSPWLTGSASIAVECLAWVILVAAPVLGGIAARRHDARPRGPVPATAGTDGAARHAQPPGAAARDRQAVAAGRWAGITAALTVTVLGTGTIALIPRAGWVLRLLYPGHHLIPAVAHSRELLASGAAAGYFLILLTFPVIGFGLGAFGMSPSASPPRRPPGDGPPYPEPAPGPPPGGRRLPAADQDQVLAASLFTRAEDELRTQDERVLAG